MAEEPHDEAARARDAERLRELEARLDKKAEPQGTSRGEEHFSQANMAWRMVTELVAGLAIGFGAAVLGKRTMKEFASQLTNIPRQHVLPCHRRFHCALEQPQPAAVEVEQAVFVVGGKRAARHQAGERVLYVAQVPGELACNLRHHLLGQRDRAVS